MHRERCKKLLWPLTETARMWSFAVTTWGQLSLMGPHFSAASLGYVLTENKLLRSLANPGGIGALNLCVALGGTALAVVPHCFTRRANRLVLLIPMVVITIGSRGTPRAVGKSVTPPASPLRFAIISENIADVRDFSTHERVAHTLSQVAAHSPPVDVVVLPEEFSLTSIFWSRDEAHQFLSRHFGSREVRILNTRNDLYPAEERNEHPEYKKLVYDSTTRGELGRYIKQMLMPLGEYAPYLTRPFFSVLNDDELQLRYFSQ